MRNILYLMFFLFLFTEATHAQKIKTLTDSTQIKIGSQFHLTLKTQTDTATMVYFPSERHLGSLEVLEIFPTDTIRDPKDKARIELIKKYGLTQFDSGRYLIPKLEVRIGDKTFWSDSLYVDVLPVKVDTLKQNLYDIKGVIGQKETDSPMLKYFGWILVLLLLGGGVYYVVSKKRKNLTEGQVVYTPIEKATISLKNLESKHLLEKGAVKDYYSELTDIARIYLQEAVKFPAMENTTDELIENLRKTALKRNLVFSEELVLALQKVLKQADLVKFAKSKPLQSEITSDRNTIEKTLRLIHEVIPIKTPEEEEAERNEALRIALERKQKKKKVRSNVLFITALALVIGLAYWIANKGILAVKDTFFGSPTTAFMHQEWVTSEYGDPPVLIETPKALKRQTSDSLRPTRSDYKDVSLFTDGTLFGDYYFMVETFRQKQEQTDTLSLEQLSEEHYKNWERQGARNILMQREDYKTPSGVAGIKIFGTMDLIDQATKSGRKFYYEMLIFKQSEGIQQLLLLIDQEDPNKKEIIDRIINSVEFGQLQ